MLKKVHDRLSLFICHSSEKGLVSLWYWLPLQKDKMVKTRVWGEKISNIYEQGRQNEKCKEIVINMLNDILPH